MIQFYAKYFRLTLRRDAAAAAQQLSEIWSPFQPKTSLTDQFEARCSELISQACQSLVTATLEAVKQATAPLSAEAAITPSLTDWVKDARYFSRLSAELRLLSDEIAAILSENSFREIFKQHLRRSRQRLRYIIISFLAIAFLSLLISLARRGGFHRFCRSFFCRSDLSSSSLDEDPKPFLFRGLISLLWERKARWTGNKKISTEAHLLRSTFALVGLGTDDWTSGFSVSHC